VLRAQIRRISRAYACVRARACACACVRMSNGVSFGVSFSNASLRSRIHSARERARARERERDLCRVSILGLGEADVADFGNLARRDLILAVVIWIGSAVCACVCVCVRLQGFRTLRQSSSVLASSSFCSTRLPLRTLSLTPSRPVAGAWAAWSMCLWTLLTLKLS
jgi:hypothetical protein